MVAGIAPAFHHHPSISLPQVKMCAHISVGGPQAWGQEQGAVKQSAAEPPKRISSELQNHLFSFSEWARMRISCLLRACEYAGVFRESWLLRACVYSDVCSMYTSELVRKSTFHATIDLRSTASVPSSPGYPLMPSLATVGALECAVDTVYIQSWTWRRKPHVPLQWGLACKNTTKRAVSRNCIRLVGKYKYHSP